jgi:hypothetical protein
MSLKKYTFTPSPDGQSQVGSDGTIFTPLAKEERQPIGWPCECEWCKAHPDEESHWDTLATAPDGHSWTIHWPGLPAVLEGGAA